MSERWKFFLGKVLMMLVWGKFVMGWSDKLLFQFPWSLESKWNRVFVYLFFFCGGMGRCQGVPETQNDVWEGAVVAVRVRPTPSRVDVGVPELGLATTQPDSDLSTHDRHASRPGFMDHFTSNCVFQDLGVRNKVAVNQVRTHGLS